MTQERQAGKTIRESAHESDGGKGPRRCRNRCFFCYVKGLPPGLRPSLYIRDDDLLQSFLFGSFVTLTNLTERDWRLLEQRRPSPLRVSVHATDLQLRRRMLGNPQAPDIMEQLGRLGALGIRVHAQVVLCPGVNDGPHLERTIADLAGLAGAGIKPAATAPPNVAAGFMPAQHRVVESVALVPVGLSLPLEERLGTSPGPWPLARFTPEQSLSLIHWVIPWQERFRRTRGKTFLHLSDEFYMVAGWPIPGASQYDGFPQYQNGVGMVRTLLDDWARFERTTGERLRAGRRPGPKRLVALCGALIAPVIESLGHRLARLTGIEFIVVPVENHLFGPRVTVSGLLAGADYLTALPRMEQGDVALLPRRALESSGRRFLDGLSLHRFRSLASPGRVALVERPGDLSRALWGNQTAPQGRTLCAA